MKMLANRYRPTDQFLLVCALTVVVCALNLAVNVALTQLNHSQFPFRAWLIDNAIVIPLLWIIAKYINRAPVLVVLICGPFIALVISFIDFQIYALLLSGRLSWAEDGFKLTKFLSDVYLYSLFYFAWYLGYMAIHNYFRFIRESVAALEAKSQADAAQLAMLRYQINPHFLFNTLNSISALVLTQENEKAEGMISGLSRFLRFSLDNNPNVKITIAQEMDVAREYLQIEKIRFEDRIDYSFEISESARDCLVPSLIFQPAVENAIKHAVAPSKEKISLHIFAGVENGRLSFGISDNGPGLGPIKADNGIGLANIRSRLSVIYKGQASVKISEPPSGGVKVQFEIPAEKNRGNPARSGGGEGAT